LLRFLAQKLQGGVEPFVFVALTLWNSNPLGQYGQGRCRLWALEFEGAANQVCLGTTGAVFDHGANAALGVADQLTQWNRGCPRIVTEMVRLTARYHHDEIALFEGYGPSGAQNLQPAGPALYDMEVGEKSGGEAQGPGSGEFTLTKESAPQLEGVQYVRQDISAPVLHDFRHRNGLGSGNKK
jgi:hypothetical protein